MSKINLCKAVWLMWALSGVKVGTMACLAQHGLQRLLVGWEMPPSLGQVLLSPGLTSVICGHLLDNNHLWVNL